jgi:hypothetical protein
MNLTKGVKWIAGAALIVVVAVIAWGYLANAAKRSSWRQNEITLSATPKQLPEFSSSFGEKLPLLLTVNATMKQESGRNILGLDPTLRCIRSGQYPLDYLGTPLVDASGFGGIKLDFWVDMAHGVDPERGTEPSYGIIVPPGECPDTGGLTKDGFTLDGPEVWTLGNQEVVVTEGDFVGISVILEGYGGPAATYEVGSEGTIYNLVPKDLRDK